MMNNRKKKGGVTEIRAALESASSADEMLKLFTKLESRLDERDLGPDCCRLAQQLHDEGFDPLKILTYAKRALNIALDIEKTRPGFDIHMSSLIIAGILNLLGSACFELKRYDECLCYLNWSNRNLVKLDLGEECGQRAILECLHNNEVELARIKKVMGKGDEAVGHLKKVLEIKEKMMEKGCLEIGTANQDVSDAYIEVENFKQALPFSLKALEIFEKHLDNDSKELTFLRISVGASYSALGEFDKALEHNQMSINGLKKMGDSSLLLQAEMGAGHMLVSLGKYKEAVDVLKPVISEAENVVNQHDRALAYMAIATAYRGQEKFAEARKHIKIAVKILEKQVSNPNDVATGFMAMSKLYEEMNEYAAAISLLQKTMDIPGLQQDCLEDCSVRLFSLISLPGTGRKGISSLKEALERVKKKFGPDHHHVGGAYATLGDAYMDLRRPEMAIECFMRAKDIFNVTRGPHHMNSLNVSQNISIAYANMDSFDLAIENQEKVVEDFKRLGPSAQDDTSNAIGLLDRLNLVKGIANGKVP